MLRERRSISLVPLHPGDNLPLGHGGAESRHEDLADLCLDRQASNSLYPSG